MDYNFLWKTNKILVIYPGWGCSYSQHALIPAFMRVIIHDVHDTPAIKDDM